MDITIIIEDLDFVDDLAPLSCGVTPACDCDTPSPELEGGESPELESGERQSGDVERLCCLCW